MAIEKAFYTNGAAPPSADEIEIEIVDPEARGKFFYFLSFFVLVLAFIFVKYIFLILI